MIEHFPTAEEQRQNVIIKHFNSDMKQMYEIITQSKDAGSIFVLCPEPNTKWKQVKLHNVQKTIDELKLRGYIIKKCPDDPKVFSIWWEVPYLDEHEKDNHCYNWETI